MTQVEQRPDENSSAAQAEIERLTQALSREHNMHLRALADFDNYRKRMQREWDSASQAGKRQLVLALLDVMDDFERAFAYASTAPESLLAGTRVIRQRLTDLLQAQGVVPYKSVVSHLTRRCTKPSTRSRPIRHSRAWCSTNSATGIAGVMRCCDRPACVWRNELSVAP